MATTLGYTSVGANPQVSYADYPSYHRVQAVESFSANKIRCYCAGEGGSRPVTFGLYSDSGGNVGAKLGDTGEVVAPAAAGWVEASLDSPMPITAGQHYWLCQSHGQGNLTLYADAIGTNCYSSDSYSPGTTPAVPNGQTLWLPLTVFSIYAEGGSNLAGQIVFEGDSWTAGTGSTNGYETVTGDVYPRHAMDSLGNQWAGVNHGHTGDSLADLVLQSAAIDALYDGAAPVNVLAVLCGINDISGGRTAPQVRDDMIAYCQARRAAGWKVLLISLPPNDLNIGSAAFNPVRNAINAYHDAHWREYADGYCALHLDSRIGKDGCEMDATYYGVTHIHLTDAGYLVLGRLVSGALGHVVYRGE